jgi:uncharacterized membrane protein (UPF0127 family)
MNWLVLMAAGAMLALSGCAKKEAPVAEPPVTSHVYPTHAQGKLPAIRLWLGPAEVSAEMALTPEQVETGMMFRTNLDENSGMIFVFARPSQIAFWMKNCTVPLSAGYIDPQGELREIRDLEPQNTNSVVAQSDQIQYVLEVNQGWFKRHQVVTGVFVRTERGTLQETFFRRTAE